MSPYRTAQQRRERYRELRIARGLPVRRRLPSTPELRRLIAEHGTYAAVARLLGTSSSAVLYQAQKAMIPSRYSYKRVVLCAVCGLANSARMSVRKYYLMRSDKSHRTGAGSIGLCERCWTRVAAPSSRKKASIGVVA